MAEKECDINKIEAWNNLAIMVKFFILEEYIKKQTGNHLIELLNALYPKVDENAEQLKESIEEEVKQKITAGFITEFDKMVNKLCEMIIDKIYKIIPLNEKQSIQIKESVKEIMYDSLERT